MRRIIGLFIVMIFLFGCLGPGPEPENVTDDTIGNVTIITTPQENQTVTPGNGVVENGEVPEEPVVREMNYTLDENANILLYFIHTGQPELVHGEAILLKKGDFDMLIDAGPAESSGIVVNFLESKQVDDIEGLLSTAADPMRYGGMEDVISSFEVEEFWWGGNCFTDSTYCGIVDSLSETANVMECSEEACVIKIMFTPACDNAPNKREEIPGTPTIPLPVKLNSAMLLIELIPLMGNLESSFELINVPSSSGRKVFKILIGMSLLYTGKIVGGKITFAPKCDNSIASL